MNQNLIQKYQKPLLWIHSSSRPQLAYLVDLLSNHIFKNSEILPIILCASEKDKNFYLERQINNEIYSIEEIYDHTKNSFNTIDKLTTNKESKDILELSTYSFFQKPFIDHEIGENKGPRASIGLDVVSEYFYIRKCLDKFLTDNKIDLICCLNPHSIVGCVLKNLAFKKTIGIFFWEKGLENKSVITDPIGVNHGSKLAIDLKYLNNESVTYIKSIDEDILPEKNKVTNILIPLQMENDTNVKIYSKFKSNLEFLQIIELLTSNTKNIKIKIRPHPRERLTLKVKNLISNNDWIISKERLFENDLNKADIVFVLNSTSGYEAIKSNVKTFMFANSIYSNIFRKKVLKIGKNNIQYSIFDPKLDEGEKIILLNKVKESSLSESNKTIKIISLNNNQEIGNQYLKDYHHLNHLLSHDKLFFSKNINFENYKFKIRHTFAKFQKLFQKFKNLSLINNNIKNITGEKTIFSFCLENNNNEKGSNILNLLWKDLCKADDKKLLKYPAITNIKDLKKKLKLNPNSDFLVLGHGLLGRLVKENIDLSRVCVYYTHTQLNENNYDYLKKVKHIFYLNSNSFSEIVSTGISPKKCTLFRLGINRELFKPKEIIERDIDIIFVQSFFNKKSYLFRKRFEAIVKIANKLSSIGKKVIVIGKNWDKYEGKVDFKYLDIPHSDTPNFFNRSKIYANVAYHEGGCCSLLEGLSMDCFVITSRTGFANDIDNGLERITTFTADTEIEKIYEKIILILEKELWIKKDNEYLREEFLSKAEFKYCSKLLKNYFIN